MPLHRNLKKHERNTKHMNMRFARTGLIATLLLVVILSVTGGTIAWFTDTVEITDNTITSGNLDMVVEYLDENDTWQPLAENTKLFNENALYEPGYTEAVFLRVTNKGNLAFKWQAHLGIEDTYIGTSVEGNEIKLSEYLVAGTYVQDEYSSGFEYWPLLKPSLFGTRDAALATVSGNSGSGLKELKNKNEEGLLLVAEGPYAVLPEAQTSQIIAIVLNMPETVGNEANHAADSIVPKVDLGLHIIATQAMHEEDSFGADYDADATYPDIEANDYPPFSVEDLDVPTEAVNLWNLSSPPTKTDNTVKLDKAFVFTAKDTVDEAKASPYAEWHADFVVTVHDDLAAGTCGLAGQYDNTWTGNDWLAFDLPQDAPANTSYRLLRDTTGIQFNYEMICDLVKVFNCGVFNRDEANVGKTITVDLRMYEPATDANNTNTEEETGKSIVLASKTYTLEAPQAYNKK